MKKIILNLLLSGGLILLAENVLTYTFSPPATIAGSTQTNLTSSTAVTINNTQRVGPIEARIFAGFTGAGTGNVIFYYAPSYDGVTFETATNSNIKVTVPSLVGAASKGDWFVIAGIHSLKLAWIDNQTGSAITNLVSNVTITPINGR